MVNPASIVTRLKRGILIVVHQEIVERQRMVNSVETKLTTEPGLTVEEFVDVLQRSTLAERRPVNDTRRIEGMLRNANIIVAARTSDGLLVGVSRAITDFYYCTYLSDLAVDREFQGNGIGKRLIDETHKLAGLATTLILLSAPAARTYYPHVGLHQHDSCWIVRPSD